MPQTDDMPDVWVNGIRYPVVYDPDCFFEGYCDLYSSRIVIHPDRVTSHGGLRELVLHELLHAIDRSFHLLKQVTEDPTEASGGAIYLSEKGGVVEKVRPLVLSEPCVNMLSTSLYSTFTDPRNRAFMDWLLLPEPTDETD